MAMSPYTSHGACGKAVTPSQNPSYQIPSSLITNNTGRHSTPLACAPATASNASSECNRGVSNDDDTNVPVLFQDWQDYCQSDNDLAPYPINHLGQALWVDVDRAIDPFVEMKRPLYIFNRETLVHYDLPSAATCASPGFGRSISCVKRSEYGLLFHRKQDG